ncbi:MULTISPECIES: S1 family peptidase [unclassified Streptomyces]|uniref:S1 family peptidase n=1 Tax=Streptomyces sp. NBC_00119 TaxID=2975659 RepID=A0AAU1TYI9_9ACTN|nr:MULTISPECIES: S1 family peptidase [unclassified Streptomyces]MCX4648005.1 S1 family peptidase [Streptomyces sp. NBC_01446]MCX5323837.1 S1 family peptidase [Streptomyces sp. NBC_00120]
MQRAWKQLAKVLPATLLVTVASTVTASADNTPKPLTDPVKAQALEGRLGADRTGGVYYKEGRIVIAVSDPAAAQTVRDAGGISKVVTRSKAELASIHRELDRLGGIPNTAWGVKPDTNQVSVKIFDGAPSDSRARIEKVAAAHPGAIHIDRIRSTLKFKSTDLRGGNGITSDGYRCTAGFNTKNSSGTIYTLTAGHCPGSDYYMDWNNQRIGYVAYSHFGGSGGDQATIRANDPGINPLGTVRYWGGTYKQIDSSRFAIIGEHIDRIGVSSQDTTGSVTNPRITVNIEGTQVEGLFESNVCALGGDSGGPALNGSTALGLLSGGTGETVCNSSSSGSYLNYFMPVQKVLNDHGLHVY